MLSRSHSHGHAFDLHASFTFTLFGVAGVLHAQPRTVMEWIPLVSSEESAKFVRFARMVERAEEVFEWEEPALAGLKTGNPALGDVTPLSLLDTDPGADTVLDTLGRIKQGDFARCALSGAAPRRALPPHFFWRRRAPVWWALEPERLCAGLPGRLRVLTLPG